MLSILKQTLVAKYTEVAERVAAPEGIEIVDVQLLGAGKARVLRIFIDKPGNVSHTDCELISHRMGAVLDAENLVDGDSYTLEVSSPGVERKLSKPQDFERFSGQKVKLVLHQPVDGQRRLEGLLAAFSGGEITLETGPGKQVRIPLQQVEKANLKFEW